MLAPLLAAQEATNLLAKVASAEKSADSAEPGKEDLGLNLKFTLDGRFVGDVGELLAVRKFKLKLHHKQGAVHDGTTVINKKEFGVQVKCRRESTVIDFSSQPELLLVIEIAKDWSSWEVIYNGPADFLTADGTFTADDKRKLHKGKAKQSRRYYLEDLAALQKGPAPDFPQVCPKSA